MLNIIGNDIVRGGRKIGWIIGNDIYDEEGRKLGYFSDNDIYDSAGRKIAYIEHNEIKATDGRSFRLDENRKKIIGGSLTDAERAAIQLLIGD